MSGARKPSAQSEPEYVPSVELKTAPVDYRFSTSVDKSKVRQHSSTEQAAGRRSSIDPSLLPRQSFEPS